MGRPVRRGHPGLDPAARRRLLIATAAGGPTAVVARNTDRDSPNRMHDDTVARSLGYRAGLVPGVTVYAYLTRAVVDALGPAWVASGSGSLRLLAPVYDAERLTLSAAVTPDGVTVTATGPAGPDTVRATLAARPGGGAVDGPPERPLPDLPPEHPLPEPRPDAAQWRPQAGQPLGSVPATVPPAEHGGYLAAVDEPFPYDVVHPALLLHQANRLLMANVELGPWLHVGSDLTHHATAPVGAPLSVRGRVAAAYERTGHRFVDVDVAVLDGAGGPVLTALHRAIWAPRPPS